MDSFAAAPPDVWKGCAFLTKFSFLVEALPRQRAGSRRSLSPNLSNQSGEAESSPHIRRHSRNNQVFEMSQNPEILNQSVQIVRQIC
jgi:hypothetical protein